MSSRSDDVLFAGVVVPAAYVQYVDNQREVREDGQKKGALNAAVVKSVETLLADFISQNRLPSVDVGESPVAPVTLAQACQVVLEHLDVDHRRLIGTFAGERKLPIEAFIMSAIVRIKERGETGVVLHEWLQQPFTQPVVQAAIGSGVCAYCSQPFKVTREGQQFCPPPADESDSCGRKFNMAKIKADLESRRRPPSQFAPPASLRLRTVHDRINSYIPK